ncbi:SCP2 sterol-binding domain-containing protein [Amphritea sp. 1_MG-2023]|uniref:ubiquinone biosynthesis accessory factor UbiJ n=1 Tax=Amphritea sp. 1_MG-2023 TaxID=3062670 RepID=UPI0026E35AC6|nr:SCP2 sterol-binding domain-containing protein [Amphritea sp. 1_MG-2023]MDO6563024.1 SCP2 sterol-binding domain-containing protein [Amphritea sp. 1_MG-2023]
MSIETLYATLLTLAEETLNRLLLLNPDTVTQLQQLDGKVIAIQLTSANLALSLQPSATGIQLDMIEREDADVTLSGSPTDFLRLLSAADSSEAMFGKTITVSGDNALATRFSQILIDTALDWEGLLAQVLGDLPAHEFARYLKWKASLYLHAGNSLKRNIEEYVTEELRLLPSRPEINHFTAATDSLRQETERAAARIERLRQKINA